MTTPSLPEQIELHRDRMWRRDEERRVESALDAERFIEDVGFANTLTDARLDGRSFDVCCAALDQPFRRHLYATAHRRARSLVLRSPARVEGAPAQPELATADLRAESGRP